MTPELLSSISAILISLAASYLPGFSAWFETLDGAYKRLLMLALISAAAACSYALACAGWLSGFGVELQCSQAGMITLSQAFVAALIANQAAYTMTPRRSEG